MSLPESKSLEERLRLVEDRLIILNMLAGSSLSSDVASETYWQSMFADDAVMDRGDKDGPEDRSQIINIVRSAEQASAIASGMAHAAVLPYIQISGDRAVATGYLQVLVPDPTGRQVNLAGKGSRIPLLTYHLTVNRWEFERTDKGWQVVRRIVRPIATPQGQELLKDGIKNSE